MAVKNSWTSDAHCGSGSPSPEAFPDGTEVFGGLDSEDDAGDEEEGAPPQAEPEGILDRSHDVSSPGCTWCLPTSPVPRGTAGTPHAWPHALLLPLSTELCIHDGLGTLTQGSAIMSQRITWPLSRATERGWQLVMC